MLTAVTFKWNANYLHRYTATHANVLEAMVRRHYRGPLRFVTVTDDPEGVTGETFPLWPDCESLINASGAHLPSCYRRLKLFDPETQAAMGIAPGERIVSLDLDTVITGGLGPLWNRDDDFTGWAVRGTHHARVFNGSMWMLRAGACAHVWRDFDPDISPREAREAGYLGSDQSWISYCLQGYPGWGEEDGVYSFPHRIRANEPLPGDARVVMFHGRVKPWHAIESAGAEWVADHWRLDKGGRCLILGWHETVWQEAAEAMKRGRFDAVIASPEAAEHWRGPILAVAVSDDHAERLARVHGYSEFVFCGRQPEAQEQVA